MTKINYQALREAAERAIPAMERLLMLPVDDDLISEQELKDYGVGTGYGDGRDMASALQQVI